ncbi:MAG TPA: hypothetical protein VE338_18040 [Ktedonobacterales bacterium]|nr:hypothetical protein [Ktedonobacterales bacterium]
MILKDLSRYLLSRQPTGLMIAARFGGVRLFASTVVRDEVYEHLDRLTNRHGIAIATAHEHWRRTYAPLITFLDPTDVQALSPRGEVVAAADPDDVPTSKIIELIRPHAALSEDHHLSVYTIKGRSWTEFAAAARDSSRRDADFVVVNLGTGFALWLSASAVGSLVSLLRRTDRRLLKVVGLAATLIAALLIAHPVSRGWLREKAQYLFDMGPERLHVYLAVIGDALIRLHDEDVNAKLASGFILEQRMPHEAPRLVRDYIPEILSRSHVLLTADEIVQEMVRLGYKPKGAHPERHVTRVLGAYPLLFEEQRPHRWGLRTHAPTAVESDGEGELQ